MTKRRRWLLLADVITLVLLILFVSDTALVLPVRPYREFWGLEWPPFVGGDFIRVPDWVEYASFIAILVAGAALGGCGLWVAGKKVRMVLVEKRKAVQ
ncbi:MAG: hypothetical protein WAN33_03145 [Candidatus Acidiferrales bacterium]